MMSFLKNFFLAFCAITFLVPSLLRAEEASEHINPKAKISFEKEIRPIFKVACAHCHGEEEELGGEFDVRLRRFLINGGDSGPAIVPGKPDESYLLDRVKGGEMPPTGSGHPLSEEEISLITEWIKQGAPTLRSEPEKLARGLIISEEDRAWWSFQPVVRPSVTQSKKASSPIDSFVMKKLEKDGFTLSGQADRRTLIRRAYFDLLGVTPAPEKVTEFVNSKEPDAWEKLIDELLADSRFGERWGRRWLDVAGYADSEGVTNKDPVRPWAWKYRDYVIKSFNSNKPYNQFLIEQFAGDELVKQPFKEMSEADIEKLIATGFLRMAPDGTMDGSIDRNLSRNQVVIDTLHIVGSSVLGMTMHCAQCHEHRYDPIPQADYYRMRAVFEPALDWKKWKTPSQRRVSLYTDKDRAEAAELEKQAKEVLAKRTVKQNEFIDRVFEQELKKLPEAEQKIAAPIRKTAVKDRTPEQKAMIKKYPSLNVSAGSLYLYDRKAADSLKEMQKEADDIRAKKPKEEFLRVLSESPGSVPATFVFNRGDHDQPKAKVTPAGLSVLQTSSYDISLPENDPDLPTSGRRLAYARYLTSGKHPLVARVMVNRFWMYLIGEGIVDTPGDFGKLGSLPTHPELLDWLASEFVEKKWDMKHVVKTIMLSSVYQQSLDCSEELRTADPDNKLYGRANLKRLEAETLRDSILEVSGKINRKAFGPPVPVMADLVGQWVIGTENLNAGRPGAKVDMKGEEFRRSVYVQVRRSRPLAVLDTFDGPRLEPNCELRNSSTVAPQSLMLMNGDFTLVQADFFAQRLIKEAGDENQAIINRAWQLAFNRNPTEVELSEADEYLKAQQEELKSRGDEKTPFRQQAIASLCQVLLSSNEFLYID